jgi:HemY protein
MIRVVAFLVITALLALGVVWLADRPGQVAITWLGYRTDTSVMVAMIAIGLLALAAIVMWWLLGSLFRSPKLFSLALRDRQRRKRYEAISRGLIAIGAGRCARGGALRREWPRAATSRSRAAAGADRAAQRRPRRRRRGVPRHGGARRHPAARPARTVRRGAAPQRFRRGAPVCRAGRQGRARARLGRAGVLEFRCQAGDWEGAIAILESQRKSGMIERDTWRRLRAVLLTARALEVEDAERDVARAWRIEATAWARPGAAPTRRPAARRSRRAAQGRENHRGRLEAQSASRSRGRATRRRVSPRLGAPSGWTRMQALSPGMADRATPKCGARGSPARRSPPANSRPPAPRSNRSPSEPDPARRGARWPS